MSEHRWPPQPGDLVKVERLHGDYGPSQSKMLGEICEVVRTHTSGGTVSVIGRILRYFRLSDLSPAEPPQTIEQFGRTYRLVECGRTDKERLDWLGQQDIVVGSSTHNRFGETILARYQKSLPADLTDIRETIDAAISATKEPTP